MKNSPTSLPEIKFSQKINDYETMFHAVSLNGISLKYASDSLRDNHVLATVALSNNTWSVEFMSSRIKSDRKLMLQAVKKNGAIIGYLPHFADDKIFAKAAVRENGDNMQYVSDQMKNDKELALIGISNNNYCVKFLSDELKNNKEIAISSLCQSETQLTWLSSDVKILYKQGGLDGLRQAQLYDELNLLPKKLPQKGIKI